MPYRLNDATLRRRIIFAGEKVRPEDAVAAPEITESDNTPRFRLLSLEGLVRMKLIANRDKDRTHLRDMLDVGLIDESWCDRLPRELAERLRHLIATPDG
jgi:hypothetical protein